MTSDSLKDIVTAHGKAKAKGATLEVAADLELCLFAVLGQENLLIDRVRSVEMKDDYLVAATRRETYVLAYEDVRAVRVANPTGGAGYES